MNKATKNGLDALHLVWARPAGWRIFSEVNNTVVGMWYLLAGLFFFGIGGVLALLMRIQLAWPMLGFLGPDSYNQVFTMHGTVMMVVFAVPIMEAVAVYLVPQMLGVRDLPFPRLSAYGFWCYAMGGLLVLSSIVIGQAPDAGWFMYTPLSSKPHSPGFNTDFWLLGITFIEISALTAAIEIVVGVMKSRAPGLTFERMPVLVWAMLVVAVMIVFAFPPLLLADSLLEAERVLDWPFYDATRAGDPLLWQHLFWWFGHPEVYIIFLPAAGIVSTLLPTFCRRPLVGYRWVVMATIATGIISFALWVHHMFASGIPHLSLSFFSAASMAVAVPSGIQVFAWIATLWGARPLWKTPFLFILGFLFIFVMGGLTGVMVASTPLDWQVHDTHFVVAHFHYVLIGGAIFPLFAGLAYWFPLPTGKMLNEALGRWSFWLMFAGFNVTFFPLHILGLLGMPRRVYTYPGGLGWEWLNLTATLGSFVLGLGTLLFLVNLLWSWRKGEAAGLNPWGAGTLEWQGRPPVLNMGGDSIPRVSTRYPLWDEPEAMAAARDGAMYLNRPLTGGRETLRVNPLTAEPEQVIRVPGPTWVPLWAALATSVVFGAGVIHAWEVSAAGVAAFLVALIVWAWRTDVLPEPGMVEAGEGVLVPTYSNTSASHAWWAGIVAVVFDLAAFLGLVSAYVYLWLVNPAWPPPIYQGRIAFEAVTAGAAMLVASAALVHAGSVLHRRGRSWGLFLWLGAVLAATAFAALTVGVLEESGLDPTAHAYPAVLWMLALYVVVHLAAAGGLVALVLARQAAGLVAPERRMSVRLTVLAWHYAVFLGLASLALVALWPPPGAGGLCS